MNLLPSTPLRLVEWFCTVGLTDSAAYLSEGPLDTPITGLCLVYNKDEPPNGYNRLAKTWYGNEANFNMGNTNILSSPVYLCTSRVNAGARGPVDETKRVNNSESQDSGTTAGSDSEDPIVDVIVIHVDKGERCPPGYSIVPVYGSGPQHRAFALHKHVQIAYSRSAMRPPLLDLTLCRGTITNSSTSTNTASHNQASSKDRTLRCPRFYHPHKRSLNPHISSAIPLYLCTRHALTSLSSLPLRPSLIDRIPRSDCKGQMLPVDQLALMAFPEGIIIASGNKPPQTSTLSFVMTLQHGPRLHCVAHRHWECVTVEVTETLTDSGSQSLSVPMSAHHRRSSSVGDSHPPVLAPNDTPHITVRLPNHAGSRYQFPRPSLPAGHHFYAPKAIVLVSYYPYYQSFTRFLTRLHSVVHQPSPLPIEHYLSNLWESPLPRAGHLAVQLNCFNSDRDRLTFLQPSSNDFPIAEFSFLSLFRRLSVDLIIDIVEAMLNEYRIVLRSDDSATLTPISESLCALLFPFQWVSPYTPVLPVTNIMLVIEGSEMPMMCGVNANYCPYPILTDSMAFIDLDIDRITIYRDARFARIPEELRTKLRKELIEYAHVDTIHDSAGASDNDSDSSFNVLACRAAFLHFFVVLLRGVDDFMQYPLIVDESQELSTNALFDKDGWLSLPYHRPYRQFYKSLTDTQIFAQFIQDKTYQSKDSQRGMELLFFDHCCQYELRHKRQKHIKEAPNLLLSLSQRSIDPQCFLVPPPDTVGLNDRQFHYHGRFPVLDIALWRQARPITQAYLRQDTTGTKRVSDRDSASESVGANGRKRGDTVPTLSAHDRIVKSRQQQSRDQRPSSLSLTPSSVSKTQSPHAFSLMMVRDIYATWFELWLLCLPYHSDIPTGVVRVLEALVRMTKQNVIPDEGIFRSILIICGRFGKKSEANQIFQSMKKHGVKPTPVTYAAYHMATLQRNRDSEESTIDDSQSHYHSLGLFSPSSLRTASSTNSGILVPVLDPYRLQAEKWARQILKAQRQHVLWNSLCMSAYHRCQHCQYEMSEGEVLACWHLDPALSQCTECCMLFEPKLTVVTTIVTRPAKLKQIIFNRFWDRRLSHRHRRYQTTVPLMHPAQLRKLFMQKSSDNRDQFVSHAVFRTMQEPMYWNLIYQLSHPHNHWDLSFLVDLPPNELQKLKIKRLKRINRSDADDPLLAEKASIKVRMIEGSEGLREREVESTITSVDPTLITGTSEASTTTGSTSDSVRQSPSLSTRRKPLLTSAKLRKFRLEGDESEEDTEQLHSESFHSTHMFASPSHTDVVSPSEVDAVSPLPPSVSPSLHHTESSPLAINTHTVDAYQLLPASVARSTHGPDWAKEKEITRLLSNHEMIRAMQYFLKVRLEARKSALSSGAIVHSQSQTLPYHSKRPLTGTNSQSQAVSPIQGSSKDTNNVKSKLMNLFPTRTQQSPQSAMLSSTVDLSPAKNDSLQQRRQRRSNSVSKSHSSNEIESLKSSLASVVSTVVTGFAAFDEQPSPNRRDVSAPSAFTLTQPVPDRASTDRTNTDSLTISTHSSTTSTQWFPIRDASPLSRLHDRCMFECFVTLGLRHYDSYMALCEAFTISVAKLDNQVREALTSMDMAPTMTVMTIEVHLGLKRKFPKSRRNDAGNVSVSEGASSEKRRSNQSYSGKKSRNSDESEGKSSDDYAQSLKPTIGSSSNGMLPRAMSSPSERIATTGLSRGSSTDFNFQSPLPTSPSLSSPSPVDERVTVTMPIASPVLAQSSPSPPAPSTPASKSINRSRYETPEEYGGAMSDWLGPNADYSGLTPSSASSSIMTPSTDDSQRQSPSQWSQRSKVSDSINFSLNESPKVTGRPLLPTHPEELSIDTEPLPERSVSATVRGEKPRVRKKRPSPSQSVSRTSASPLSPSTPILSSVSLTNGSVTSRTGRTHDQSSAPARPAIPSQVRSTSQPQLFQPSESNSSSGISFDPDAVFKAVGNAFKGLFKSVSSESRAQSQSSTSRRRPLQPQPSSLSAARSPHLLGVTTARPRESLASSTSGKPPTERKRQLPSKRTDDPTTE